MVMRSTLAPLSVNSGSIETVTLNIASASLTVDMQPNRGPDTLELNDSSGHNGEPEETMPAVNIKHLDSSRRRGFLALVLLTLT